MKILVLSCNTGGGHNACGKYIEEEFRENGIECKLEDYLKILGSKLSKRIEQLYLGSTKGKGNLFKGIYKIGEIYNKSNIKSPVYILNKLAKEKLLNYIKENEYDLVICTHLFPSMVLTEIKKEYDIKFINVATDYECIPFWNETNPDYFIIPSELLIDKFINKGFSKDILIPLGMPISSNFLRFKNNLDLPKDKDIVTVTSGSMGFGNMTNLVKRLLLEVNNVYFVVICGNNSKLETELKNIQNPNLIVKGFVNNMNEYIHRSKIVISKPGGLTTTEVAVINKPLIHMMPIPGVETYNAKFFAENKMSLCCHNIEEVINNLKLLLKDEQLQQDIINNQRKLINRNSAKDLVSFVKKHFTNLKNIV